MAAIRANPPPPDADADAPPPPPVQGDVPTDSSTEPTPDRPAEPEQGDVQEEGDEAPKPGGRFARLRDQLTQAEQRARQAEQQFQQRDQRDQQALNTFVNLVLTDAQFETLRIRAEGGDWEAKQQLDSARAWRQMAGPIHDVAQHAVKQEFDQALESMRTLDGMDSDGHQRLLSAATPGDKLKLAWQIARKSAETEHKERIAALEAEVASLKTNRAATGGQPAGGGNRASNGSAALAGLLGPDGLPTEEAIVRARNGAYRDLGITP